MDILNLIGSILFKWINNRLNIANENNVHILILYFLINILLFFSSFLLPFLNKTSIFSHQYSFFGFLNFIKYVTIKFNYNFVHFNKIIYFYLHIFLIFIQKNTHNTHFNRTCHLFFSCIINPGQIIQYNKIFVLSFLCFILFNFMKTEVRFGFLLKSFHLFCFSLNNRMIECQFNFISKMNYFHK